MVDLWLEHDCDLAARDRGKFIHIFQVDAENERVVTNFLSRGNYTRLTEEQTHYAKLLIGTGVVQTLVDHQYYVPKEMWQWHQQT